MEAYFESLSSGKNYKQGFQQVKGKDEIVLVLN